MKLFNLFKKKEAMGLELAEQQGLITHEEFLRITSDRAVAALDQFIGKQKKIVKPKKTA